LNNYQAPNSLAFLTVMVESRRLIWILSPKYATKYYSLRILNQEEHSLSAWVMAFRSCGVQENEVEWLSQAQAGDGEAFGHLVEAYQVPVYNLCNRMLGNAQEAEDAAQETFMKAYNGLRSYDRQKSFSTWLLSIAAHYSIDQIRRRRMTLVSFEALPYQDLPDPGLTPEATLSKVEEQRRIRDLLETLNPTDRAAVIMYYWHDLSYTQIAEALKLTESAVKSRLHRARVEMAKSWMGRVSGSSVQERSQYESPAF
jgi:RNA polymerase sigma-70 factor (ECF subfamily)